MVACAARVNRGKRLRGRAAISARSGQFGEGLLEADAAHYHRSRSRFLTVAARLSEPRLEGPLRIPGDLSNGSVIYSKRFAGSVSGPFSRSGGFSYCRQQTEGVTSSGRAAYPSTYALHRSGIYLSVLCYACSKLRSPRTRYSMSFISSCTRARTFALSLSFVILTAAWGGREFSQQPGEKAATDELPGQIGPGNLAR